jgi:hypothetical protein
MKRRRWKPEQKALIVLEGLKGRPIGELCSLDWAASVTS